jgi:hypothetical protein
MSDTPDQPVIPNMTGTIAHHLSRAAKGNSTQLPECGHFGLRIASDGSWYYRGSLIERQALVKLFASVLRLEDDGYYLVTPIERGRIDVDDAPFTAVALHKTGLGETQILRFETNLGEQVTADAAHNIMIVALQNGNPRPYIVVRDNLRALITRPIYYDLVELAVPRKSGDKNDDKEQVGVWSAGTFFPLN